MVSIQLLFDHIPQMMFLLLLVFALLLKAVYLFSPFHYLQHLVFALHFHSLPALPARFNAAALLVLLPWLWGCRYCWFLVTAPAVGCGRPMVRPGECNSQGTGYSRARQLFACYWPSQEPPCSQHLM